MKVSEMIQKLKKLQEKHGDILVVEGDDWRSGPFFMEANALSVLDIQQSEDGFNYPCEESITLLKEGEDPEEFGFAPCVKAIRLR